MNRLKVQEHPGLFRDPVSHAIIVDDPTGRKNYQNQREIIVHNQRTLGKVTQEVEELRSEISDIKSLLTELVRINKQNK